MCLVVQMCALSAGSNVALSHSLLQAARKRPALASMLIHPWLALPTPVAPLPTPQLQLTMAPSSPGPSPLGLAPTECEPHTPMPMEGRQHQGVSPCTTASEETVLSCEMATPDSRFVSSALHSASDATVCRWSLWVQLGQLGIMDLAYHLSCARSLAQAPPQSWGWLLGQVVNSCSAAAAGGLQA